MSRTGAPAPEPGHHSPHQEPVRQARGRADGTPPTHAESLLCVYWAVGLGGGPGWAGPAGRTRLRPRIQKMMARMTRTRPTAAATIGSVVPRVWIVLCPLVASLAAALTLAGVYL